MLHDGTYVLKHYGMQVLRDDPCEIFVVVSNDTGAKMALFNQYLHELGHTGVLVSASLNVDSLPAVAEPWDSAWMHVRFTSEPSLASECDDFVAVLQQSLLAATGGTLLDNAAPEIRPLGLQAS